MIAAIAGLFLVPLSSAWGDLFPAVHVVDLNRPGAMERVRASNPGHHDKIVRILDGLTQRPYDDVPRWINTTFQARDVRFSPIVMTTYPAQRDLTFVLDSMRYRGRVTLAHGGAIFVAGR